MSFAYYVCCIYTNAHPTNLITEANAMNPDQTAPKGAVSSGSILIEICMHLHNKYEFYTLF